MELSDLSHLPTADHSRFLQKPMEIAEILLDKTEEKVGWRAVLYVSGIALYKKNDTEKGYLVGVPFFAGDYSSLHPGTEIELRRINEYNALKRL